MFTQRTAKKGINVWNVYDVYQQRANEGTISHFFNVFNVYDVRIPSIQPTNKGTISTIFKRF